MNSSVMKRIVTGFTANVYGQTVNIFTQLFGVPILLYFWGANLYGEWLILSALPVFLSMSDFGLTSSAGNDMTQLVARGDLNTALIVFQSTAIFTVSCSLIGLALVIVFLNYTSASNLLPIQILTSRETSWVIGFLASEVILTTHQGCLNAGFRSCGEYAFYTMVDNSNRLIQNVLLWLCASLGGGPVEGAAAMLLIRLISTPLIAILLVRKHSWIFIGISNVRFSELKRLFRPAFANLALSIAISLHIQGIRVVVGAVLGAGSVVIFTTLRTLTRLVLQICMTIGHASEPEMAAAFGKSDVHLLRKLYIRSTQLTFIIAFGLTAILFLTGQWILKFWTHGKVLMDYSLFGWLVSGTILSTFWYNSMIVLKAANHHVKAAIFFMIMAALAVASAYFVASRTGCLSNIGIVLLLMEVIVSLCVIPNAIRISGGEVTKFMKQLFYPYVFGEL